MLGPFSRLTVPPVTDRLAMALLVLRFTKPPETAALETVASDPTVTTVDAPEMLAVVITVGPPIVVVPPESVAEERLPALVLLSDTTPPLTASDGATKTL